MSIKFDLELKLNPADVEALIRLEIERQMPDHNVKNIKFQVSSGSSDRNFGHSPSLTGVTVVLEPKERSFKDRPLRSAF